MRQQGRVARRFAEAREEMAGLKHDGDARRQLWGLLAMAALGVSGLMMIIGGARLVRAGNRGAGVALLALGTCLMIVMSAWFFRAEFAGRGWRGAVSFLAILLASVLAGQLATGGLFRLLFHR